MTRDEKLQLLKNWKKCYENNEALFKSLKPIFGNVAESPIYTHLWNCFDELTVTTERLLGSNYTWLDWYCWENEMGKNGMGNTKPIKTLDDLLDLMEKK